MKILLVNPYIVHPFPSPYPPLGVGYICAYLRSQGRDIDIVDLANNRQSLDHFAAVLEEQNPDIIGISVKYPNLKTALKIGRTAKRINPYVYIVYGGSWANSLPQEILENVPEVDCVCRNEGELTFSELVDRRERDAPIDDVAGISHRRNGAVVHNPPRELVADLDDLPSPYHMGVYDLSRYKVGSLVSARGCYMKCLFCSAREIFRNRIRFHSIERTLSEIEIIYKAGIREFVFFDDTFLADTQKSKIILRTICEQYSDAAVECLTRFDRIDDELVALMKKAGIHVVNFGLESGNLETLKRIRKGTTPEMIRRAHGIMKKGGLKTLVNIIVGLPGEDEDDIRDTFSFAKSLNADVYVLHALRPYPNTDLYREHEKYGVRLLDEDSIFIRRAETDRMSYPAICDMVKFGNTLFDNGDFYTKVIKSERIDIYDIHVNRCLL